MPIKFGTDPEYFAYKTIDGVRTVIPAAFFRVQLGMKHRPDKKHPQFFNDKHGHVIHEDGVAFEVAVPPQTSWRTLVQDVYDMQEMIDELLVPYSEYTEGVIGVPAIHYDYKRWEQYGEQFAMCNMFGCDPDKNAFEQFEREIIMDVTTHTWRYGGGHIHFSGHPLFDSDPRLAIKLLAATVGLAASGYSPVPELEKQRTFLYGKAGKYRLQKYPNGDTGIEYRTPSVSWTARGNQSLTEMVFSYAELALNSLMNNVDLAEELVTDLAEDINEAILDCNQPKCLSLLSYIESKA